MSSNPFEEMRGKVAVITGATSGIGEAAARLCAQQGIYVALAGRSEERGKELERSISEQGGKALFIQTDVSKAQSVENLIKTAQDSFGHIDYCLNSAGIEGKGIALADMDEGAFDEVMAINLKGMWHSLKYAILAMRPHGGVIVNVSTNITQITIPKMGAYTASKAGVESLTRTAAIEESKRGLRINAISPGAVDTPMIHRIFPDEQNLKALHAQNPMHRIAFPEEIASTALWLFSPMAAHVNGEVIFVDGGGSLVG